MLFVTSLFLWHHGLFYITTTLTSCIVLLFEIISFLHHFFSPTFPNFFQVVFLFFFFFSFVQVFFCCVFFCKFFNVGVCVLAIFNYILHPQTMLKKIHLNFFILMHFPLFFSYILQCLLLIKQLGRSVVVGDLQEMLLKS